jgi:hypothetical protein
MKNIAFVLADLFQYIGLMHLVSREDQASLLNALNQLEAADHEGEHFSLRQWVEKGDM